MHHLDPYGITVHPAYRLLFCKTAKAGSSSWMHNFELLFNISILPDDTSLHLATNDFEAYYIKNVEMIPNKSTYIKQIKSRTDYLKFILVRHPFDRLLSAYTDKLENKRLKKDGTFFYNKYGARIVRWFRVDPDNTQLEPTFREFVRYLISTPVNLYNYHWKPASFFCYPCLIKYDVVVKMETFLQDSQYILHKTGLQNVLQVPWRNRNLKEQVTAEKYFSSLSETEMKQLYERYSGDFLMFNYSAEEYMKYVDGSVPHIPLHPPSRYIR